MSSDRKSSDSLAADVIWAIVVLSIVLSFIGFIYRYNVSVPLAMAERNWCYRYVMGAAVPGVTTTSYGTYEPCELDIARVK